LSDELKPKPPSPPDAGRVPTIDLLRGIAILLVVLYHVEHLILFPAGYSLVHDAMGASHIAAGSWLLRLVFLPFHMGRVGVNLFFVISGLCIHLRFARDQAADPGAPFSLATFFLRRFFRIYPVYWAALAIGAIVAPPLYGALYADTPPAAPVTTTTVLLHVFMLHSFSKIAIMSVIVSMWSIATEEQFYLLYPLVFVKLGRRLTTPRIVVGLLVLTVIWRLAIVLANPVPVTFSDGPFLVWVFGFSLPRYYEWSLGALLAYALARGKTLPELLPFLPPRISATLQARTGLTIAAGVGLIALGAATLLRSQAKWLLEDPLYSTGWFLVMSAALLPRAARARAAAPAWLRVAGGFVAARLRSLGRRSFSVYLLHEISIFVAAGLMIRYHLSPFLVAAPLACVLIWASCYAFNYFIEAPFERRSKAVGRPARPAFVATAAVRPTDP
jgi:peptidoglycan/LPS O-acetylase OafA/YrhL